MKHRNPPTAAAPVTTDSSPATVPADLHAIVCATATRLGLAPEDVDAVLAKIAPALAGATNPRAFAQVVTFHYARDARRVRQTQARQAARDAERAARAAVEAARIARLRAEYVEVMSRLPGSVIHRAEMAMLRKFEGRDDAQLAAEYGGTSRACRDQWVCRGAKAVIARGVSRELAAFLTQRGA